MSTTIEECRNICPVRDGTLKLHERDSCQRYGDDCEECDKWADEEAHEKKYPDEKKDWPYQNIVGKKI